MKKKNVRQRKLKMLQQEKYLITKSLIHRKRIVSMRQRAILPIPVKPTK